jgi:hypothetical protein
MSRARARWAIAFLIGLATVSAAALSWRAAQIGSTAAFDDRTSISETVRVEQGKVERTIAVAADTREYARYRADYAVAAALDRKAERLTPEGVSAQARVNRADAAALREGATRRAVAAGVFGRFTLGNDLVRANVRPRPFDPQARERALAVEQATGLDSPGSLDPGGWARQARDIRVRMNGLSRWAFVVLVSVLLYAIAEVSQRRRSMYALAGAGLVVYAAGMAGGFSTVFF